MDDIKRCSKSKMDCLKTNFNKDNKQKDGLYIQCKICRKKYSVDNKDRRLKKLKFYKEENRDQIIDYEKKYKKENRDRIIEHHKKKI